MHGLRTIVASLALTGAASSGPANAIVAQPAPRACASYSKADIVLAGIVGAERDTSDWNAWPVTVERTYKGAAPRRFTLYSPNNSARGTPDEGRRNILFIHRERGRFIAWGSDPNTGGRSAIGLEREVSRLARAPRGTKGSVVGLIADESGAIHPGWRVRLHRRGSSSSRVLRADARGRFAVELPPGHWAAKVAEPGWASRSSLYTYNDPDGFDVHPGGCSDLRLEPVQR